MNKELVYLVQTDTTVGFSSHDDEKLSLIKQRSTSQKILQTIDSFKTLQRNTRIPKNHKKRIRKATLSTFIYPSGNSYRVVDKKSDYYTFLKKIKQCYSTSANKTKEHFDYEFASAYSDVLVINKSGFLETQSSSIYKLYKRKFRKIR